MQNKQGCQAANVKKVWSFLTVFMNSEQILTFNGSDKIQQFSLWYFLERGQACSIGG
jgi:hypothetical protein